MFSLTEIVRQFLVLFYLNGLRENFLQTSDELIKNVLRVDIENFHFLNDALFSLFILAFALGNIFYGIGLLGKNKLNTIFGWLFVFWAIMDFTAFFNQYWDNEHLSAIIDFLGIGFQTLMRAFIGMWLLHHIYPSFLTKRVKNISI